MPRGGEGPSAKYQYYETKDHKFVLFCGIEQKFWRNFCVEVGRPDLLDGHDESVPVDFGPSALRKELQAIFHQRTLAEWMDAALPSDVAMGPANQLADLASDPHLTAREIIVETVHPQAGEVMQVGWPAPVAGQPFEVGRPAPELGEHTDEVLRELGYSDETIAALRQASSV